MYQYYIEPSHWQFLKCQRGNFCSLYKVDIKIMNFLKKMKKTGPSIYPTPPPTHPPPKASKKQYISNLRTKRTSIKKINFCLIPLRSRHWTRFKWQILRSREHKVWWLSYCRASLPLPRTLYSLMEGEESLSEQKQKLSGLLYKQMKLHIPWFWWRMWRT